MECTTPKSFSCSVSHRVLNLFKHHLVFHCNIWQLLHIQSFWRQLWSLVSIRLTKQMLVSGMMSLREMASSLPICSSATSAPKLKERGREGSEPFNYHAIIVILTKHIRSSFTWGKCCLQLCAPPPLLTYCKHHKKFRNVYILKMWC